MGSAGWEAIRKIVWEAMMVPGEGLHWPLPVSTISPKDQAFRPFREIEGELKRRMSLSLALA